MKDGEERSDWEGVGEGKVHFLHNRKCCTAWMATNGILLYAMKKPPNDGGRTPEPDTKSLNRTEKRSGQ